MLPELIYYFARLAGSRRRGHHRAERVLNAEVPYVRYLIGRIMKEYDYINRVDKTLPLNGLQGYVDTLCPLVAMHLHGLILRVRRIFYVFHAMFPNSGSWYPHSGR